MNALHYDSRDRIDYPAMERDTLRPPLTREAALREGKPMKIQGSQFGAGRATGFCVTALLSGGVCKVADTVDHDALPTEA